MGSFNREPSSLSELRRVRMDAEFRGWELGLLVIGYWGGFGRLDFLGVEGLRG